MLFLAGLEWCNVLQFLMPRERTQLISSVCRGWRESLFSPGCATLWKRVELQMCNRGADGLHECGTGRWFASLSPAHRAFIAKHVETLVLLRLQDHNIGEISIERTLNDFCFPASSGSVEAVGLTFPCLLALGSTTKTRRYDVDDPLTHIPMENRALAGFILGTRVHEKGQIRQCRRICTRVAPRLARVSCQNLPNIPLDLLLARLPHLKAFYLYDNDWEHYDPIGLRPLAPLEDLDVTLWTRREWTSLAPFANLKRLFLQISELDWMAEWFWALRYLSPELKTLFIHVDSAEVDDAKMVELCSLLRMQPSLIDVHFSFDDCVLDAQHDGPRRLEVVSGVFRRTLTLGLLEHDYLPDRDTRIESCKVFLQSAYRDGLHFRAKAALQAAKLELCEMQKPAYQIATNQSIRAFHHALELPVSIWSRTGMPDLDIWCCKTLLQGVKRGDRGEHVHEDLCDFEALNGHCEAARVCAYSICKKFHAPDGGSLQRCGRCKREYYCMRQHQRLDWKEHKLMCMQSGPDCAHSNMH